MPVIDDCLVFYVFYMFTVFSDWNMFSSSLLESIKSTVGVQELEKTGQGGGGCINQGEVYNTEKGKLFLKYNEKEGVSYIN